MTHWHVVVIICGKFYLNCIKHARESLRPQLSYYVLKFSQFYFRHGVNILKCEYDPFFAQQTLVDTNFNLRAISFDPNMSRQREMQNFAEISEVGNCGTFVVRTELMFRREKSGISGIFRSCCKFSVDFYTHLFTDKQMPNSFKKIT